MRSVRRSGFSAQGFDPEIAIAHRQELKAGAIKVNLEERQKLVLENLPLVGYSVAAVCAKGHTFAGKTLQP